MKNELVKSKKDLEVLEKITEETKSNAINAETEVKVANEMTKTSNSKSYFTGKVIAGVGTAIIFLYYLFKNDNK